jgi:hypothetical protein
MDKHKHKHFVSTTLQCYSIRGSIIEHNDLYFVSEQKPIILGVVLYISFTLSICSTSIIYSCFFQNNYLGFFQYNYENDQPF